MYGMKYYIYSCLCLLFILGCVSCNEDKSSIAPTGTLCLSVDRNDALSTKALKEVTDEVLNVYIANSDGDTIKTYNDYLKEVRNEKILLPIGTYKITVCSNQSEEAGWEKPFYVGEKSVEIKSGEITATTVTCTIANTKVSVFYTDDVKNVFVDYITTVSNSCGSLTYVRDEYRSGFFIPEKLVADLKLVRKKDGQEFYLRRVFPDIEPRFHYTLSFRMASSSEDEAGGDFNLTVDKDAERVDCEIVIDESTLEHQDVPEIKLSESFEDNKIILKEGQSVPAASLSIKSLVGLQSLVVEVNSELFQSEGLLSFDLLHLDDVTNMTLSGLKFPVPANQENYNDLNLDFNELLSFLLEKIKVELDTKIHTFTFYAMDKLHQEVSQTVTFDVSPKLPAKTVKANAFAKYAYLYGESSESTGLGFKYKLEGEREYKTIEANPESDGTFSALITNLQPGKTYVYYAIAGEDLKGAEKTFNTEKDEVLPNASFEEWNGNNPWASGSITDFWDTGNGAASTAGLVLTQSSDYVPDNMTGKSAYLKSQYKNFIGQDIFAAGNLFSGVFGGIVDLKGADMNFGQPFTSRPSKLTGYYKYISVPIDWDKKGGLNGKNDRFHIYVMLVYSKHYLNTLKQETFFDYDKIKRGEDPGVIGFGELTNEKIENGEDVTPAVNMAAYEKFEIPIVYYKEDKPSYIIVTCTSSKYGDYYTGGIGSQMWVDAFELIYDDAPNNE